MNVIMIIYAGMQRTRSVLFRSTK